MSDKDFKIILFYKYINIDNPVGLRDEQLKLSKKLNLRGRMIVASEGMNGTFEGTSENIEKYIDEIKKDPRFSDIHWKVSEGNGNAFPKLSVKVRKEIVAARLGEDDFSPREVTGKYLKPEELHQWFQEGKEFFIVDMRNDFEQEVGHFEGSIFSGMKNFDDLPKVLPKIKHLKGKTILTVCTGGVRCEKASGFLVKHGFKDVYQLYGGIVSYMEKYPNENFLGALYVFDGRIVMGFNMDDPKRVVVGKCVKCNAPSENYINCLDDFCHRHFIVCEKCLDGKRAIHCPMGCRDYSKEHPEVFI